MVCTIRVSLSGYPSCDVGVSTVLFGYISHIVLALFGGILLQCSTLLVGTYFLN
ncbi:hypothetical protein APHCRT_0363 [Anaplasma phagocytophilum str. CRT53-1]|uniref:Uncharacterized protein n=2 Tax=Anaplasma phagocytophilum TaxID=948 RepID=A0A0F3PZN6_ANAPH|nr:hypothetical protein APHWEB_0181 [Anaplasma phagocytophilum str. Webster]KJV84639.1 hypothetical protein APHWI1_1338 [Anaplasma phagocytophilum str. ApWI1]KJV87534.1 hypothetical protein APHCRT_0363 [Anaplasma phagocytophilum str. CRT53-1]KJV88244.1 hypothetical protein APHNYW_0288 [Anaplasma phagocytophilum str. ApNYW]KJV99252.1 hypothetical protein OTSANNIE_0535 [Anaplasma phagocytophilum str. Annie]